MSRKEKGEKRDGLIRKRDRYLRGKDGSLKPNGLEGFFRRKVGGGMHRKNLGRREGFWRAQLPGGVGL